MSHEKTKDASPDIESAVEVHVSEAIGTIFLGILAIILLVAFIRVVQRNHELEIENATKA